MIETLPVADVSKSKKGMPQLICKLLGRVKIDHLAGDKVALVAHQELVDHVAGISINFLFPGATV